MSFKGPKNSQMFDLVKRGCRVEIFEKEPGRPFLKVWKTVPDNKGGETIDTLFSDFLNKKPNVPRQASQGAWTRALNKCLKQLECPNKE